MRTEWACSEKFPRGFWSKDGESGKAHRLQSANLGLNLSSALHGCETYWLYLTSRQVPLSKEEDRCCFFF